MKKIIIQDMISRSGRDMGIHLMGGKTFFFFKGKKFRKQGAVVSFWRLAH